MKPEDLAQLSSDALLVVRHGRVAYANDAAASLLASCGLSGVVGHKLDDLWEEAPQSATQGGGAAAMRRVRTCGTSLPVALDVLAGAAEPGDESGAFGVRIARAESDGDAGREQALVNAAEHERLQRLQAAINEAADAISVLDPQRLEYLEVNEAAGRMRGIPREEMRALGPVGMLLRASGHEDAIGVPEIEAPIRQELTARYNALIANYPEASVQERTIRGVDGRERRVESVRRAFRSSGRWLIILVNRDITARYAATQRQEIFRAAMDGTDQALFIVDPQAMRIVDVNRKACELRGLTHEECMALPAGQFWRGKDAEDLAASYQALIAASPQPEIVTDDYARADGSLFPAEVVRVAVRIGDRWVIVVSVRDISKRRAAQLRLEQLRSATDQAPDAIMLVDPEKMEFLAVNEAACRLYASSRAELMSRGIRGTAKLYAITTMEDLKQQYEHVIASHPASLSTVGTLTIPGHQPRIVEWSRRAVQIEGRWMVVSIARDITKERAEQQRLQLLKAAMNQAVDAMFVADPESMEYLDANEAAARLLGIPHEQLLAEGPTGMARRLYGRTEDEVRETYGRLIAAYPSPLGEVGMQATLGGGRVLEWSRCAVRVEERWLIISIARDVTERVHAQEELKLRMEDLARSNQDLEQFAYVTSHDLSEPLRMIASYTQLLERRYSSHFDQDAREFMGYITDGAQRMRQLIDDLLTYSRAGRREVHLAPLCLDEPLKEAMANLARAVADSGATIERPHALPTLPCDRSAMMQLFQNLVGNALKFRGEQPLVVRIEAQEEESGWKICVRDNGIGIEPKYFERIFVIFQRLHARTAYAGTGIGLAICKRIVERHGGRIWVESEPGQGAAFCFFLPLPTVSR